MNVTVKSKEELEKAVNMRQSEILITGDLAEKIRKAQNTKSITTKIGIGGAALALILGATTAPVTGGLSLAIAGTAATAATYSAGTIITCAALATLGLGAFLFKVIDSNYDLEIDGKNFKLTLKKSK